MIRWRVVWAFAVMIDRRSPINWFIRVDLPTFGLPTMLTKPDLKPSAALSSATGAGGTGSSSPGGCMSGDPILVLLTNGFEVKAVFCFPTNRGQKNIFAKVIDFLQISLTFALPTPRDGAVGSSLGS